MNDVPEIHDLATWYGAELAGREDWIERLSEVEIGEVERAVREVEGARINAITPGDRGGVVAAGAKPTIPFE